MEETPKRKRGRPSTFKTGSVIEPDYTQSYPEQLIKYMEQGMLDCQIFSRFNITRDSYFRWRREYPEFEHAHQIGMPKCEAWWVDRMVECWRNKDDKGFKYCISIMNNKFGWGKDDPRTANQTINVGSINVIQQKSRTDLLEYIKLTAEKHKNIIDVEFLESEDKPLDSLG